MNSTLKGLMRELRAGEEDQLIQVLDTVFSGWPAFDLTQGPLQYWHWRYSDNRGEPVVVVVYEVNGEIVGCVHSAALTIRIGDENIMACLAGDTALLEAFRGQGLVKQFFRKVIELRKARGIRISYAETRTKTLILSLNKSNAILPCRSRHLVRIGFLKQYLLDNGHTFAGVKAIVLRGSSWIMRVRFLFSGSQRLEPFEVCEIQTFDERFQLFWEEASRTYSWIVQRDRTYLNWRYTDPRAGTYRIFCASSGERVFGYVVVRISTDRRQNLAGYIVDLLCMDQHEEAASALIRKAISLFQEQEVDAVHCLVPADHPYYRLFFPFGFMDSLERIKVFLRPTEPMDSQLQFLNNCPPSTIYYTYGDIDSI